ncbi:MAG: hypothetical protein QOD90_1612, partial [Mycobacterium sp.]|nr:hypothetical protein [Mycobacterium sp.]
MDHRADRLLVDTCGRPFGAVTPEAGDAMTDAPVARVQRVMPAAPDVVFDEWLDPESLADWMCPRPARCVAIDIEPHVG